MSQGAQTQPQSQGAEQPASSALLAAIVESTSDAIVGADISGRIVSWNPGAEKVYGYRAEEIIGRPGELLLPPGSAAESQELGRRLQAGERIEHYESKRRRKDGTLVDVEVTISPIKDADGEVLGLSGIVRDISCRKRAEEELRHSNEELEQFAYAASHDLSEPLRVIAGFVELLAQRYHDALDDDARRFIDFTVEGVERMQTVIDDLLTYSRAGRMELRKCQVDCGPLVGEVLQSLMATITDRGTAVDVEPLPSVWAEPTMLRAVFQNLIGNAVKFTDSEQPRVHVSAERKAHCWRISVRDNGPGIDARHLERVFEMFQRLHGRDVPGTGIGLALVRRVIVRHGGEVWCTPAEPRGTVFTFTLPDEEPGR